MDNVEMFIWTLLRERLIKAIDETPEKLKEEDMQNVLNFLESYAASNNLEDYELAAKIRDYKKNYL